MTTKPLTTFFVLWVFSPWYCNYKLIGNTLLSNGGFGSLEFSKNSSGTTILMFGYKIKLEYQSSLNYIS